MGRRAGWGRGLVAMVFVVAVLAMAAALPDSVAPAAVSLDWSEWHDHHATSLLLPRRYPSANNASMTAPCLRDLVRECSLQLEVPRRQCGNDVTADDFRVPFFYSRPYSLPSCGFEAPVTPGAIDRVASRYTFRFIGDDTTRRLAETFVAIATGEKASHSSFHDHADLSRGDLKVFFDFAPLCSGVGDVLRTLMAEDQQTSGKKRAVIITAFGAQDAHALRQIKSGKKRSPSYLKKMPHTNLQANGLRVAALESCREATAQTVEIASGGNSSLSPLVFLLQNNGFRADFMEQAFLDDVRKVQEAEIGNVSIGKDGESQKIHDCEGGIKDPTAGGGVDDNGGDAQGRVFVVETSVSLYDKLWCYQEEEGGRYYEPVKLVEAKMLWDLLKLVDPEHFSPILPANWWAVDIDERSGMAAKASVDRKMTEVEILGSSLTGADAVWSTLQEATSSGDECEMPPCAEGKHVYKPWSEIGEEMMRIQGAVVVRRPDLATTPSMLAPANSLDFGRTLESYIEIFNDSLAFSRISPEDSNVRRFVDAVSAGNSTPARYLSPYYYTSVEVQQQASDGYEAAPTLAAMADVFINPFGYIHNARDYIVPNSCKSEEKGPTKKLGPPVTAQSFGKVYVIAQWWGYAYYHFLAEGLPRITYMLDILREHDDIKIVWQQFGPKPAPFQTEFLELLGIDKSRTIFTLKDIHADLAIIPDSTVCGMPNAQMVSLLRNALLKGIYPSTGGIPSFPSRPVIVLIVRTEKRGIYNSDEVRDALQKEFPNYDVVEFLGTGSIKEQLETFATASVIVGPHGAGLTNAMVAPLHTAVVEIGPQRCPPCYMNLMLKLQHVYSTYAPDGTSQTQACDTWWTVDTDNVLRHMRDLLEAQQLADVADPPRIGNHTSWL